MKYDSQLSQIKNLLPGSQNILIALPSNCNLDTLAAGLALDLSLEAAGKNVTVVCDDTIKVAQAHLFGIDHVKNTVPGGNAGNLVLTLEGVASSNGTIPALEKLDWFAENNNLNLVFHVMPGQTFNPVRITPKYQTGSFDTIFVLGAPTLANLGMVYQSNLQVFSNAHMVNIDNQSQNTNFGQSNVVDQTASSISEMVSNIITDLGYAIDGDTATNLLSGIFDVTQNLANDKVSADTYQVVSNCLKMGGKRPQAQTTQTQAQAVPAFGPQFFQNPGGPQPDLSALFPQGTPQPTQPTQASNDFVVPQVVANNDNTPQRSSSEERPAQEGVVSETVEPDWLTPKIFKGSSIG